MASYERFTVENATKADALGHFKNILSWGQSNFGRKGWGSVYEQLQFPFLAKALSTESEAYDYVRELCFKNRHVAFAVPYGKNNWFVGAFARD